MASFSAGKLGCALCPKYVGDCCASEKENLCNRLTVVGALVVNVVVIILLVVVVVSKRSVSVTKLSVGVVGSCAVVPVAATMMGTSPI